MKIEISEEDYKFLKECKKELLTQDNGATGNPIFCIQEYKQICGMDSAYSDSWEWVAVDWDYQNYANNKELFENLKEKGYIEDIENLEEFETKLYMKNDLEFLDERLKHIQKISYIEIGFIPETNTFSFFEKDSLEHLENNKHHYSVKARTYTAGLWRSSRMGKLRNLIENLDI